MVLGCFGVRLLAPLLQAVVHVKRRWQLIRTRLVMGASSYVQALVCDVSEPLALFVPYAARKFQIEGELDQFLLYASKSSPLALEKSILDLDWNPDLEFLLANKTQPIPDSFSSPSVDPAGQKVTLSPRAGPVKAALVSVTGTVTLDKKKRYVVLEGAMLTVYKDQKEMDKPLQSLELAAGEYVLQTDERDRKRFQFDLVSTKNKKDIHQFKLETDAEFQQWLPTLEAVVGAANSSPSSSSSGGSSSKDHATSGGGGGGGDSALRVFGASLAQLCGNEPSKIPYLVSHCIQYLDSKALDTEGIFRLSGSQVQIDRYRDQFNSGVQVDLTSEPDHHTVSGLLKLFFREMPEPLLTFELYESFIAAQAERDSIKRIRYVRHLLTLLPVANRATLKYLMVFLSRVEKHSAVNKMAMHNLATVFGPNLLSLKDGDVIRLVEDTPLVNGLVNTFIKDFDLIFSDEEPPEVSPLLAQALYDYAANTEKEISFKLGDVIKVHKQGDDNGWWYGELNGKRGMFPGSYVRVQVTAGPSKRDKFMQEMSNVRAKIAEEKKLIEELEAKRTQLYNDIDKLKRAKELATSDAAALKQRVAAALKAVPELAALPAKLEVVVAQLESYHKTRSAMLSSKQALITDLAEFKKALQSESKYKKLKDKVLPLLDGLMARFEEEQAARAVVDEKKDQVMKDLSDIRIVVAPATPRGAGQ